MLKNGMKPCPFCGDTVNAIYNSALKCFFIYHDNKACILEGISIDYDSAKSLSEAKEVWNTRKGEN